MSNSPNLGLPFLAAGQAQKHVTLNAALSALDALVQLAVTSTALAAPPGSPAEGDRYIVAAAPTGAWAGQAKAVAVFQGGVWVFQAPDEGWLAWDRTANKLLVYDGAAWIDFTTAITALQNLTLLGIGTTADATNPFSAKLNKTLWTAKTAAEGGDGDLRYTLNKETAVDVVSLLFQSGFSGRAELGLIGDDDVTLKVSADGASWNEAIRVSRASGAVWTPTAPLHAGLFHKTDTAAVAFVLPSSTTVSLKAGARIALGDTMYRFDTQTVVQMPTLTAGTDYAIYLCGDGTVRADANFSAPTGFTTTTSRKIGGFHHAPGANATAYNTGGGATPAINPFSLWDLKWRPACPDPRGMTLVAGQFWADIYLLGVDHHVNGTSRNGATIADGGSSPKVPVMFGGDGTTTYILDQFAAAEIMASHGKSLMDYAEFSVAAFGVLEAVSRGNDPITTGLGTTNAGITNTDQKFTSIWGLMQATGVLWAWGRDKLYRADGIDAAAITAFAWKATTSGRGSIYAQGTVGIVSALLGGDWGLGSLCGSRASYWSLAPWYSPTSIGARGRCDHLIHV